MRGASGMAFVLLVAAACSPGAGTTQIGRVASESKHSVVNGNTSRAEYFVVAAPPRRADALRKEIDKAISSVLREPLSGDYDLSFQFYEQGNGIDAAFRPRPDPGCIMDCDEPLHIWDVAEDGKLASVYIKKDACQIHTYYFLRRVGGLFEAPPARIADRKILDPDACRTLYGRIPGTP